MLPAARWGEAVLMRAFGPDARPSWREMKASGNWRTEPAVAI